jgi:hypothetical protein
MTFQEYLGYSDEDSIGYLTNLWKEELMLTSRQEASADRKESAKADGQNAKDGQSKVEMTMATMDDNDPIKKGLRIIEQNIRFRDVLMGFYEKKDPRALFSVKDKVFLTYTLIDFFDKEFSYIFTSNKVEFNIVFLEGNRADMKKDLSATYYKLSGIYERTNEYLKIIREIRKLESDAYLSIQERSARSNQYSLQRSQISRTLRREAKEFFDEFSKKYLVIISDFRTEKKIVQNAAVVLEFDKKLSGERFADGKQVIEAIEDAYYYSSSLNFLLSDGDLGGYSLMCEKPAYLNIDTGE